MLRQVIDQKTLRSVDPITDPAWAELVSKTPSSVFHSPQWMRVIHETYGLSISACILERHGQPVAGAPWCEADDIFGTRRVTLAFSDYCDILASTPQDARIVAEFAAGDQHPWTLRTFARNVPDVGLSAGQATEFKWHGVDLTADSEALWSRLSSMARRGVRKAEKSGVTIRLAKDKDELRHWYLLHLRLRKAKYSLLAQPYAFFESIWDNFVESGQGFLLVAVYQDQIIGGNLYLLWKDTCYYKFNASDGNHLLLRPNNLMMWQGILEAKGRGCTVLDLGRSDTDQEGLISFKRGFGAAEDDLCALTYNQNGSVPEAEKEARRIVHKLTPLLAHQSVPDSITEDASALLYHLFT